MPDPFFASSNNAKKRKRPSAEAAGASSGGPHSKRKPGLSNGPPKRPNSGPNGRTMNGKPTSRPNGAVPKAKKKDEDLESDAESSIGSQRGAAREDDEENSEDEDETPAEKRLRLAKLYLDGLKDELADGDYDAAEIDRDIINERLRRDVLEHSGKLHLFVAEKLYSTTRLVTRTSSKIRADDTPAPSTSTVVLPQASSSKAPTTGNFHHRLSVTSAVLSEDGSSMYTSSKEGTILRWSLDFAAPSTVPSSSSQPRKLLLRQRGSITQTKPKTPAVKTKVKGKGKAVASRAGIEGHTDEVWCLALSGDDRYLVSGGKEGRACVWDVHTQERGAKYVKAFDRHRDSISSVAFRKKTNQVFTTSFDRTVNLYDLSPGTMGYVETLFGHQDKIYASDSLRGDAAVTCGGRDKTCRWWKVGDETQLVFRGGGKSRAAIDLHHEIEDMDVDEAPRLKDGKRGGEKYVEGSIECVAMVDDSTFLSGGDSGSICLWSITKKKPVFTYALAHGLHVTESSTEGDVKSPRWVTSLASMRYSDLFASGSWDGQVRLWRIDQKLKSFSPLQEFNIAAKGMVNSLQILSIPESHRWATSYTSLPSNPTPQNGDHDPSSDSDELPPPSAPEAVPGGARVRLGAILVAGVGQEMRTGRWVKVEESGVKNCALVVGLEIRC